MSGSVPTGMRGVVNAQRPSSAAHYRRQRQVDDGGGRGQVSVPPTQRQWGTHPDYPVGLAGRNLNRASYRKVPEAACLVGHVLSAATHAESAAGDIEGMRSQPENATMIVNISPFTALSP